MKKIVLAAIVAASASSAAFAETYVFGNVGQGNYKDAELDKSGTSFNLGVGYGLGNGLAVEAGYQSYGTVKVEGVDLQSSGLFVGGVYDLALNKEWSLVGRLGLTNVKTEVSFGSVSVSTTKIKPYVGFGGAYAVSPSLKLEAGFSISEAELEGGKADLRNLSVSVRYSF